MAKGVCYQKGGSEVMVIGGEMIYRSALPVVSKMYLTEVEADIEADTFFPDFDRTQWVVKHRQQGKIQADFSYNFTFLERR